MTQSSLTHRKASYGSFEGPDAFIDAVLRPIMDIAPDTVTRRKHHRVNGRTELSVVAHQGTVDGGQFETAGIVVLQVDADGLTEQIELFDESQADEAWRLFEELGEG